MHSVVYVQGPLVVDPNNTIYYYYNRQIVGVLLRDMLCWRLKAMYIVLLCSWLTTSLC